MSQLQLDKMLLNKQKQTAILNVVRKAVTSAGHSEVALLEASFFILLEKSEEGKEEIVVRAIDFQKKGRKGHC